jgi:hypothetical protein
MAAIIELKYYNSFWLKKIQCIADVLPSATTGGAVGSFASQNGAEITVSNTLTVTQMNVGQKVSIDYTAAGQDESYEGFIIKRNSDTVFTLNTVPNPAISGNPDINFGPIEDFTNIPQSYRSLIDPEPNSDWYIEEARIRGGYNNTTVDFGVKAYAVDDVKAGEVRTNAMIYSGIYNSKTGVNNTNQFSVAEDITRAVNIANGAIQKLYTEDTNLIIFQERKVSRALIDKDAIYTQEGQALTAASNVVIGGISAYNGEFGISRNPESFAVYGYQKYFVDTDKGAVLRLSLDGITEISNYGMYDYFRDNLSSIGSRGLVLGGYDIHNKCYTVSIQDSRRQANTLSFDEKINGWTSRYSYVPNNMFSIRNNFYTTKDTGIYRHYSRSVKRGTFYNTPHASSITTIFNTNPSVSKNFKTINYEGQGDWSLSYFSTGQDTAMPIGVFVMPTSLSQMDNQYLQNQFKQKEDKYFSNLINTSLSSQGEVVFGNSISGVKGFTATAVFLTKNNGGYNNNSELFAVSTEFVESSY